MVQLPWGEYLAVVRLHFNTEEGLSSSESVQHSWNGQIVWQRICLTNTSKQFVGILYFLPFKTVCWNPTSPTNFPRAMEHLKTVQGTVEHLKMVQADGEHLDKCKQPWSISKQVQPVVDHFNAALKAISTINMILA